MAPSDEGNKRQKAQDDVNPFILFRRFADDQMSTLMNGVFSISSLFGSHSTSPRRSIEDYENCIQEARESSQRLAREAEEAGKIMDVYARAYKQGQHAFQEPASDYDTEPLRCPYSPAGQEVPQPENPMDEATRSCLALAALSLRLPSTVLTAPVLGEPLSSFPVAYLLYSPYSPVRLEQHPHLCDQGATWRQAFEDLLAVQSGQDLPPKCSQGTPESSIDWMRGMIRSAMCKGEEHTTESSSAAIKTSETMKQHSGLLSHLSRLGQSEKDADEEGDVDNNDLDDEGDADISELDMYDRIFSSQQSSSTVTARAAAEYSSHLQPESSLSDTDGKPPSILSTFTTTERTTLRDGSVHTKIVLKKRFSDGREESTETVHQQNAVRQKQDALPKSIKDEDARETGKDKGNKQNKSSGWFWS